MNLRSQREPVNFDEPVATFEENERSEAGQIESVLTVILSSRECPWKCLMCDLWKNTATTSPPLGAIARQIEFALERFPKSSVIKLYNSGSFFDPSAVPVQDYPRVAELLTGFHRVIVESHPRLIGDRAVQFRDLLKGQLEIAVGLETVDEITLEKLNKRVPLIEFEKVGRWMKKEGIDLRTFILIRAPFQTEESGRFWANRSVDFAFDRLGATVAALIPTRAGNGAMEELARQGLFSPPQLGTLEQVLSYGLQRGGGRVFADLWNIDELARCSHCHLARRQRLEDMNLTQHWTPEIACSVCKSRPS